MTSKKNPKQKELINKVMHDPPAINIGKKGVTDQVIVEIKKFLKNKRIIKIKFLKNILDDHDVEELSQVILDKTNAVLIDSRGHNIIISKK